MKFHNLPFHFNRYLSMRVSYCKKKTSLCLQILFYQKTSVSYSSLKLFDGNRVKHWHREKIMNEGQWTHKKHRQYPARMPSDLILSLDFISEQEWHLLTGNALWMLRHNQIIATSILHNNCFSQVNKCATLESFNYCQQDDVSIRKCNFKRNLNGAQHCPND